MENILVLPEGIKDFYGEEYNLKKFIEHSINGVFHKYGYDPISTPAFEKLKIYDEADRNFKLIDRDDSVLSLRYDMTPSICRAYATHFKGLKHPKRLCYIEDAFRTGNTNQGIKREITQGGIELIGADSIEADGEVISVAIKSILSTGVEDFKINISNTKILQGMLTTDNFTENEISNIKDNLIKGDFVEVNKIVEKSNCSDKYKKFFDEIPFLTGDDILSNEIVIAAIDNDISKEGFDKLKETLDILGLYGVLDCINIDLSLLGEFDYYTGIIFNGFCDKVGYPIVSGGRYNNLLKKFGMDLCAVGFAINIDGLIQRLTYKGNNVKVKPKTLFISNGYEIAFGLMEELRSQDIVVEQSYITDVDEAIDAYKDYNIGGILNIIDNNTIEVINLIDMSRNKLDIDEFLGK